MNYRIEQILKQKDLSASQFADRIGVQRSSISHIISGRNKPSLDFIQKLLKAFPDLNVEWLITGKGTMGKSIMDENVNEGLFDAKIVESEQEINYARKPITESLPSTKKGHRKNAPSVQQKDVDKIVIFYSDNTFTVYSPADSK